MRRKKRTITPRQFMGMRRNWGLRHSPAELRQRIELEELIRPEALDDEFVDSNESAYDDMEDGEEI